MKKMLKKIKKILKSVAKKRIKVGLILNEFGEQNKISVTRTRGSSRGPKATKNDAGTRKDGYGVLSKKSFGTS